MIELALLYIKDNDTHIFSLDSEWVDDSCWCWSDGILANFGIHGFMILQLVAYFNVPAIDLKFFMSLLFHMIKIMNKFYRPN